jgi:TIR domain
VIEADGCDIFLSYSRNDASVVDKLVQALRLRGLKVFRDLDALPPGEEWPTLLEKHLGACRAVVVCIGPAGLGFWQRREQYVALDRQARDPKFRTLRLGLNLAYPVRCHSCCRVGPIPAVEIFVRGS